MPSPTDNYLAAAHPDGFTILGERLRPLSIWHLEIMLRTENAFAVRKPVTEADLLSGVFFCSKSYVDGMAAISDSSLEEKIIEWGKRAMEDHLAGKNTVEGIAGFDLTAEAEEFGRYCAMGAGFPRLLPSAESGRTPGAPLLQQVRLFLMHEMRMTRDEAMDYPVALACHDFFAFHEMHGRAKIANADEYEMLSEFDSAKDSDEMLKACLAALPGSKPISEADRAKVAEWEAAARG